jgi:hypothetical protein
MAGLLDGKKTQNQIARDVFRSQLSAFLAL